MTRRSEVRRHAHQETAAAAHFQAILKEFGELLSEGERELFSDPTRNWGWHASLITLVEVRRIKRELRELRCLVDSLTKREEE